METRQKPGTRMEPAERVVKDIRRRTRKQQSAEEIERANATGPREPATPDRSGRVARRRQYRRALPARGDCDAQYLQVVKGVPRAGKKRLAGDAARQATSPWVKQLRQGRWR